MSIGISISTRNRPEVFRKTYEEIRKYSPGCKIVVIDDASTVPVKEADYRFEYNAGIAATKNKGIELLMDDGVDHIFLFDDDCHPTQHGWFKPYVKSKIKHLSFSFDSMADGRTNGRNLVQTNGKFSEYERPCGCMLYFHRSVVDAIGGFDVDYPLYGMEHVDFSNRVYNAGLTPARFMDVSNSLDLLYSQDYHKNIQSTVTGNTRARLIKENNERFSRKENSREFMPYKHSKKGVVLASYFNANPDPQRGNTWNADIRQLYPLMNSCKKNGVDLIIFHDCLFNPGEGFVKVNRQEDYSPNAFRWLVYYHWLKNHGHEERYDNVFMVDSTDVEVLRNPFQSLNPNKLYVGNEVIKVDNAWMKQNQEPLITIPDYREIINANADETLINCGIVGGSREMVMKYLDKRNHYHRKYTTGILRSTDMAVFNYIVWKYFKDDIETGTKVNTRFKGNERNEISFFKHK